MKSLYVRTRYRRLARLRSKRWHEHVVAFCRRLLNFAFENWIDPWVAAFYYHYGRHPKKLIPLWLERDAEHARMEIPDYDPTIPIRGPAPRLGNVYQMPAPGWSAEHNSLRDPPEEERAGQSRVSRTGAACFEGIDALPLGPPPDSRLKVAKAPLRRIVDRSPVWQDDRLAYYKERLECGHLHIEFLEMNGAERRRCHECQSSMGAI